MIDNKNYKYWNIVKGLGILAIVIGHASNYLSNFVYLFHIVIFFFVTGYLYNEKKHGNEPLKFFSLRLSKNWLKYVLFSEFFLVLHNKLLRLNFISGNLYILDDFIINGVTTLFFQGYESLGGALWFVPVFVIASLIFGYCIYISRKLSNHFNNKEFSKVTILILLSTIIGALGVYSNCKGFGLMFHSQTSFLVVPIITVGYLFNNRKDLSKYLKIWLFVPAFFCLYYFAFKYNLKIDLSENSIGSIMLFYPISLIGIYFVLYLSKVIYKVKYCSAYFELLGKNSFEIMALHLFVFKCVDVLYSKIHHIIDSNAINIFPYSFEHLWPLYILLGVTAPMILFEGISILKKKIKNHDFESFKDFLNNTNFLRNALIILSIVLISIPILKLGIMQNDEVQSRYWSMQGFITFYKHYFIEQTQKGRTLSAIIFPFSMYLGFMGTKSYQFKFFQVISILICDLLFYKLINKTTKNKKLAAISALIFWSFLQISFEPVSPNVFVTLYNPAVWLILISLMFYNDYLETSKVSKLIISMVMFLIAETAYEAFITYVVIYLILFIYKKGIKNVFSNKKDWVFPILMAFIYLVLYVAAKKLFPSNYVGNQITNINLIKSLRIIAYLSIYSLPGSLILSKKYQYLFELYFNIDYHDVIRILLVVIVFVALLILTLNEKKKSNIMQKNDFLKIVVLSLFLIVLPILPISVASLYQELTLGDSLIQIPVSFFAYFGGSLLVSSVLLYLLENHKTLGYLFLTCLVLNLILVQNYNSVFQKQATSDFKRFENIEGFLTSDALSNFYGKDIYSSDIYQIRDALAPNNYWNLYVELNDVNINLINDECNYDETCLYYIDSGNLIVIYSTDEYYIYSTYMLPENDAINIHDTEVIQITNNDYDYIDNYYLYKTNNILEK